MSEVIKIVITGGHAATTALAVVEEINERHGVIGEIHWIGTKRAVEGKNGNTLESQILPGVGVIFHSLIMGRLQRKFSWWTIPSLLKIPIGFVQSLFLLITIRPRVILSFGGFASYPVVFWSWFLGIPVIIHEQTAVAGRANLAASRFAKRILLARPTSLNYFPKDKCMIIGNPILSYYFKHSFVIKNSQTPTIFITGGSRGSEAVNDLIDRSLDKLLVDFHIIHQVGIHGLEKFKKRNNYLVVETLTPGEMYKMYEKADVVVARAGANTVAEVMALKKPTLFIPIPWSYLNEQYENAKVAVDYGLAEILNQQNATPERFIDRIYKLYASRDSISKFVISKDSPDRLAANRLVDILMTSLSK